MSESKKELITEHRRLTRLLKEGSLKERLEEYERQMKELKKLLETGRYEPEMAKSNYGPKGAGLYDPTVNQKRKSNRTAETIDDIGPNKATYRYTSAVQGTARQQASSLAVKDKERNKKQSVRTLADLSTEEKAALEAQYGAMKKSDSHFEAQVDGQGPWHKITGVKDLAGMPNHPLHGQMQGNVYFLENHPSGALGVHQSRIKQREVEDMEKRAMRIRGECRLRQITSDEMIFLLEFDKQRYLASMEESQKAQDEERYRQLCMSE